MLACHRNADLTDPPCRGVDLVVRHASTAGLDIPWPALPAYATRWALLQGQQLQFLGSFLAEIVAAVNGPAVGPFFSGLVVEQAERRNIQRAGATLTEVGATAPVDQLQRAVDLVLENAKGSVARIIEVIR